MQVHLLKSKIHRATVTDSSLNYEGSMTIAADFMEKTGLMPFERILVSNMANGSRFETYAIPGEWGSGAIVLNGATAHLGKPGDLITIMSYAVLDEREAYRLVESGSWGIRTVCKRTGNRGIRYMGVRVREVKWTGAEVA